MKATKQGALAFLSIRLHKIVFSISLMICLLGWGSSALADCIVCKPVSGGAEFEYQGTCPSYTIFVRYCATPPATPSVPSVPASDGDGSYTISWSAVSNATSYVLQEKVGSGSWVTITGPTGTSYTRTGRGNNTYYYRVSACSSAGCSSYSASSSAVNVALAPGVPSSISAPALHDGDFTVSWGSASGSVTAYDLDRSINGASYTNAYDGTALSFTYSNVAAATYTFRVRACRTTGSYTNCSGWRTSANSVAAATFGYSGFIYCSG